MLIFESGLSRDYHVGTSANQPAPLSICRVFEVKVTSVSCRTLFPTFESGSFELTTGVRDPLLCPE
jgi:hypothetical protein